jgi:DNA-binding response OmpR family regulator
MSDKTVLVVDDQIDFLDVVQRALEQDGYDVVRATSASEALACAEQVQPICAIVDHRLVGPSGIELTRELRERHGNGMVIVMCTAHADAEHREAAERAGTDMVMAKPLDFERLRTVLPPLAPRS